MISKTPENCTRNFIISYYLTDNTLAIFEVAERNSGKFFCSLCFTGFNTKCTGFNTSTFAARSQVQLPGQKIYTSKPPVCYTPQHMFIGATLFINGFKFVLTDADEYALRYMEVNCGLVSHTS